MDMDERVYELHADICQILANPKRLKIINTLRDKELSVNELAKRVGVTKANLSQHLSILRQRRIVLTRREGVTIHYRIANPKVLKAFDIMRQVLFEQLAENRKIYKVYHPQCRERPLAPTGIRNRRLNAKNNHYPSFNNTIQL